MSEIRATTISDETGTGPIALTKQSAAKAWANLQGTGTPTLQDSFNIASVTDHGAGDYSYNFTNNMANINYCYGGGGGGTGTQLVCVTNQFTDHPTTTSAIRVHVLYANGASPWDAPRSTVSIHGDLA